MKTIRLTLNPRFILLSLLNKQQGNHVDIYRIFKLIEKLDLTTDEQQLIAEKATMQNGQLRWPKNIDKPIDIELAPLEYDRLQGLLKAEKSLTPNADTISLLETFDLIPENDG